MPDANVVSILLDALRQTSMEISFGKKRSNTTKKITSTTNIYDDVSIVQINEQPITIQNNVVTSSPIIYSFNSFKFDDNEFKFEKDNNNIIWFEGKEFVTTLGYKNYRDAIDVHINNKYKKYFKDIVRGRDSRPLNQYEKEKIYISEYGIFQLLASSKLNNPIIKLFQDMLFEEILPSIRKTGSYNVNQNIASSSNELIIKPTRTIPVRSFYDDHMITPFIGKNVLYIGTSDDIFDKDNLFVHKYGLSTRVIDRDFKEHQKNFTNFNMIYIRECDNNDLVEKLFENELKVKKLWRSCKIKNSTQTELFITNEIYDIDYIIKLMDTLIDNNPLKSIQERDQIIKQLENNHDFDVQKMNFELKLKEFDIKMKEIELKSKEDDVKIKELELRLKEEENKNKQMDLDFQLKQKQIDSDLQQKQMDFDLQQKQIELRKISLMKKMYIPR